MAIKMIKIGDMCPNINFVVKSGAQEISLNTHQEFRKKRILVCGIPGPYLPDYPSSMVWGYDYYYEKLQSLGIQDVYITSTFDYHVLKSWVDGLELKKIKLLPDGNSDWAEQCGLLVDMRNTKLGLRSHRYAMILEDGVLKKIFYEDFSHNPHTCFTETNVEKVMEFVAVHQTTWMQLGQNINA